MPHVKSDQRRTNAHSRKTAAHHAMAEYAGRARLPRAVQPDPTGLGEDPPFFFTEEVRCMGKRRARKRTKTESVLTSASMISFLPKSARLMSATL